MCAKEKKLILAPMATLSHEAFRRCVAGFGGCDEYFTEMINAGSLLNMGPWEKFYMMDGPDPGKIVWQLTGNNPEKMGDAAKILASLSGIGVDLNMGCSAPQIAGTGAGISWMTKDWGETERMVRLVKKSLQENKGTDGKEKRLSVKMRLGDEKFTEERLFDFCSMLVDCGVQMLTLHPRTKKEKYRERARWNFVDDLTKRFPDIPIILNGDIKDFSSYSSAVEAAPDCAGVMVARMAAQKPWIFKEIRMEEGDSFDVDMERIALDFIDDVEECQPEEFWKTRLRRFFAYYCLNFSFAHYFQSQMLNASDNEDSRKRVREYFEKCPDDRIKTVRR